MDDVWFRKSVEIGSILEFTSQVSCDVASK